MNRRSWMHSVGAATLATVAAGSQAQTQTAAAGAAKPATFVLVHGAWHGGWCWQRVAALLQAQGHRVYAPTLTGLADRSHLFSPALNLRTHIDDVANLIRWDDLDQVVLCGHSYGGMVISGVTQELQPRIKALVYLDAFVAEPGVSLLDLSGAAVRERIAGLVGADRQIAPTPSRLFMVNEADQAWVDAKCTPQPYQTFIDTLPATDAIMRVPTRHFVRAAKYDSESFRKQAAKLRAQQGWHLTDLPHGHDLMLDAPADVARILLAASAQS